jgi:alpha-D-ribose 1-methylphosphonate 5-phosphate C-P lyase
VIAYDVFCNICGHKWSEQDPGVTFIYGDHVWECFDEAMCAERKAMTELDQEVSRGADTTP